MMWEKTLERGCRYARQLTAETRLFARPARDDAFAFGRIGDAFICLPYLFQKRIGLDDGPILRFPLQLRRFGLPWLVAPSLARLHALLLHIGLGQTKTGARS